MIEGINSINKKLFLPLPLNPCINSFYFFHPVILHIYYPSMVGASPLTWGLILILALEELASNALLCGAFKVARVGYCSVA